jgi:hypothetical protein
VCSVVYSFHLQGGDVKCYTNSFTSNPSQLPVCGHQIYRIMWQVKPDDHSDFISLRIYLQLHLIPHMFVAH